MEKKFSLAQLDLLKEIGTIGAGRAATALSEMLSKRVEITVPLVNFVPLENIASLLEERERLFFVIDMEIEGDVTGRMFLLFPPDGAKNLFGTLLNQPSGQISLQDEMLQSSLKETANILCGSYVAVLADMTKLNILISAPTLAVDMVGAILDFIFIQIARYSEEALCIKTEIKVSQVNLEGLFLLFPSVESLNKVFSALGANE